MQWDVRRRRNQSLGIDNVRWWWIDDDGAKITKENKVERCNRANKRVIWCSHLTSLFILVLLTSAWRCAKTRNAKKRRENRALAHNLRWKKENPGQEDIMMWVVFRFDFLLIRCGDVPLWIAVVGIPIFCFFLDFSFPVDGSKSDQLIRFFTVWTTRVFCSAPEPPPYFFPPYPVTLSAPSQHVV